MVAFLWNCGKGWKRKETPYARDAQALTWEYVDSPVSPVPVEAVSTGPSTTWSPQKPGPGIPATHNLPEVSSEGSSLCLVSGGGVSIRCLVCGGLQGLLPQSITCILAAVRTAGKQNRRGRTAVSLMSQDCHITMCFSAAFFFHFLSCTWNLTGNRPTWAEKVVSAWAVNWPAFVSLSQFYCCFSTMHTSQCPARLSPREKPGRLMSPGTVSMCGEARGSLSPHQLVQTSYFLSNQRTT